MPVNDAPNRDDAIANCALCCVAGLVGSTAESERRLVQAELTGGILSAEDIFLEYATQKLNIARSNLGRETLPAQVAGVQHWLTSHHGLNVNAISDTTNPLTLGVLADRMNQLAIGTRFVVLVMQWGIFAGQASAAHWLIAERIAGGFRYTDYQLDVPAEMAELLQKRRGTIPYGAPSVSDGPREAFTAASDPGNRYMALSVANAAGEATGCCVQCYITTATCGAMGLADDCDELERLRAFRDDVLLASPGGAREVAEYYAAAPGIVAAIDRRPDRMAIYRLLHADHIAPAAAAAAAGDNATAHRLFRAGALRAATLAAAEDLLATSA